MNKELMELINARADCDNRTKSNVVLTAVQNDMQGKGKKERDALIRFLQDLCDGKQPTNKEILRVAMLVNRDTEAVAKLYYSQNENGHPSNQSVTY